MRPTMGDRSTLSFFVRRFLNCTNICYSSSFREFGTLGVRSALGKHRCLRRHSWFRARVLCTFHIAESSSFTQLAASVRVAAAAPGINQAPSGSIEAEDTSLQFRYRHRFIDYVRSDPKYAASTYPGRFRTVNADRRLHGQTDQLAPLEDKAMRHVPAAHPKKISRYTMDDLDVIKNIEVPSVDLSTALALADLWYSISESDHRVPAFHRIFLEKLRAEQRSITLPQALQSLLYCAFYRKTTDFVTERLKGVIVRHADSMGSMDIELLAFAAYVLKIDFRKDQKLLERMSDLCISDESNISTIVSLLKFLRQNDYTSTDFYAQLVSRLRELDLTECSGVECCHILQSLAFAKYYDEGIYVRLQQKIMDDIRNQTVLYGKHLPEALATMHPSERLRVKDMANFLHSLAVMDHKIEKPALVFMELEKRLPEFERRPYFLVEALHALSMQGLYNESLLKVVFSRDVSRKLASDGWKDAQRWLFCLWKTYQIEYPEKSKAFTVDEDRLATALPKDFSKIGYELNCRDEKVLEMVRAVLEEKYGKEAVWFGRRIPHVEISGFVVSFASGNIVEMLKNPKSASAVGLTSRTFAVEVVDNYLTCANARKYLGVFELKKRLMKTNGMELKTIHAWEVDSEEDVRNLLRSSD